MMSDFDKKQAIQDNEVDDIVSAIYRRFKEWNKRGFTADDVTWCEVKGDVLSIIDKLYTRPSDVRRLSDDEFMKLARAEGSEAYRDPESLTFTLDELLWLRDSVMDACNIPKEGK